MNLETMTQEQKDALLADLLAKQTRHEALTQAKAKGISWSKNGFVTVSMPKVGDKNQPSIYIDPANINHLQQRLANVQDFVTATRS